MGGAGGAGGNGGAGGSATSNVGTTGNGGSGGNGTSAGLSGNASGGALYNSTGMVTITAGAISGHAGQGFLVSGKGGSGGSGGAGDSADGNSVGAPPASQAMAPQGHKPSAAASLAAAH